MNLETLRQLPGAELILDGLEQRKQDQITETSLLIAIAETRLRAAGLAIPEASPHTEKLPEHLLYKLIQHKHPEDAHSRYNALIRRLVSFERALESLNKQA